MKKCPLCKKPFNEKADLISHIELVHRDLIPKEMGADQYYFNLTNKKDHGTCVICQRKTKWNSKTGRYDRFCSEKCKEKYIEIFRKRMIDKHGKANLLNDPEHQRKMLMARSISGYYEFSDDSKVGYVGSYEKDFLEFLDVMFGFTANEIMQCPFNFTYDYEGTQLIYIPDYYIPSLNLIIEIKDGGKNPNTHHKIQAIDKKKEASKDDFMKKSKYNYIKVVDKTYEDFVDYLIDLKVQNLNENYSEFFDEIVDIVKETTLEDYNPIQNDELNRKKKIILVESDNFMGLSFDYTLNNIYTVRDKKLISESTHNINGKCTLVEVNADLCNSEDIFYMIKENYNKKTTSNFLYDTLNNENVNELISENQGIFQSQLLGRNLGLLENFNYENILKEAIS